MTNPTTRPDALREALVLVIALAAASAYALIVGQPPVAPDAIVHLDPRVALAAPWAGGDDDVAP
ncbi:MAG TPA: hypothetical protein VFZ93_11415 [Albitalea sp.]